MTFNNKLARIFRRTMSMMLLVMIIFMNFAIWLPETVLAEGSRNLNPADSEQTSRAYTEYKDEDHVNSTLAGIARKNIVYVYAFEGETIFFGSSVSNHSSINQDTNYDGDIKVTTPNGSVVYFDNLSDGTGLINTRAKELSGPKTINESGYTPQEIAVGQELENVKYPEGIYQFEFISAYPDGSNDSANYDSSIDSNDAIMNLSSVVGAWDITVAKSNEVNQNTVYTEVKGRAFSYYISLRNNTSEDAMYSSQYIVTDDGYIYKISLNGIQPNEFIGFSNNRGFITDCNNSQSIYKSIYCRESDMSDLSEKNVVFHNPLNADTPLDKTYKIFYDKPAEDLLGVLYPNAKTPEPATNLKFVASDGETTSSYGMGGFFYFDVQNSTTASVMIDMSDVEYKDVDGITQSGNFGVVTINYPVQEGENRFYWNGKDQWGNNLPMGEYTFGGADDSGGIKVKVVTKSGEAHFPILDAENNPNGIIIERVNELYDSDGNVISDDKFDVYYDNTLMDSSCDGYVMVAGIKVTSEQKNIQNLEPYTYGNPYKSNGETGAISYDGNAGDRVALDIWKSTSAETSDILTTDFKIDDSHNAIINGIVFYDADEDGEYNIHKGDSLLSNINVALYDNDNNLVSMTQTDKFGKYQFVDVEHDNDIVSYFYIRTVIDNNTYTCTTNNLVQPITIQKHEDESGHVSFIEAKPIGLFYNYADTYILEKVWDTNTVAQFRPDNVTLHLTPYYYENEENRTTKIMVTAQERKYVLNDANMWQTTLNTLPGKYIDKNGATHILYYEVVGETYMVDGNTYYYDGNEDKTYLKGKEVQGSPYETKIEYKALSDKIHKYVVSNKPMIRIEITKISSVNEGVFLSGAEFELRKNGDSTVYKEIEGVTDEYGKLVLYGDIEDGAYELYETKAPPGCVDGSIGKKRDIDIKRDAKLVYEEVITNVVDTGKSDKTGYISIKKQLDASDGTFDYPLYFEYEVKIIPKNGNAVDVIIQIVVEPGQTESEAYMIYTGDYITDSQGAIVTITEKNSNFQSKTITVAGSKSYDKTYEDTNTCTVDFQTQSNLITVVFAGKLTYTSDMTFKKLWLDENGYVITDDTQLGIKNGYVLPEGEVEIAVNAVLQRTTNQKDNVNEPYYDTESDLYKSSDWKNCKYEEEDITAVFNNENGWSCTISGADNKLEIADSEGNPYYYRLVETGPNLTNYTNTNYEMYFGLDGVLYSSDTKYKTQKNCFIVNKNIVKNLNFRKVNALDNTEFIAGAKFKLYELNCVGDDDCNHNIDIGDYSNSDGSNDGYIGLKDHKCWRQIPAGQTSSDGIYINRYYFISNADGLIYFNSLKVDKTYLIIEVDAPEKYLSVESGEYWTFKYDTSTNKFDITASDPTKVPAFSFDGDMNMYYLNNNPKYELPQFGEKGDVWYKITGLMLMFGSVLIYQLNRKNEKN